MVRLLPATTAERLVSQSTRLSQLDRIHAVLYGQRTCATVEDDAASVLERSVER